MPTGGGLTPIGYDQDITNLVNVTEPMLKNLIQHWVSHIDKLSDILVITRYITTTSITYPRVQQIYDQIL